MEHKRQIKVGNDCRITKEIHGHQFRIGERVEVTKIHEENDCHICRNDKDEVYACTSEELEKIMP